MEKKPQEEQQRRDPSFRMDGRAIRITCAGITELGMYSITVREKNESDYRYVQLK